MLSKIERLLSKVSLFWGGILFLFILHTKHLTPFYYPFHPTNHPHPFLSKGKASLEESAKTGTLT